MRSPHWLLTIATAVSLLAAGCPPPVVADDDTADDDDDVPVDQDQDGFNENVDCDDEDPQTWPGAPELCDGLDNDCDGMLPDTEEDDDGDGFAECEDDCDDTNDAIYPEAQEECDGLDNDCDGDVPSDETDDDGDGYVECSGDCDDTDPAINPDATEVCNAIDDDCDGMTDAEFDVDGDNYTTCGADGVEGNEDDDCDDGDPSLNLDDLDTDTYSTCAGDCDDGNAAVYPGADELCNGIDDDCDGLAPGEVDGDGDTYLACEDCDDANADTYPTAAEICDGQDNDCNQLIPTSEADSDGDGVRICENDCDDTLDTVYDGAPDICDGVLDNDCDGVTDPQEADDDQDGFSDCDGDCDDADPWLAGDLCERCVFLVDIDAVGAGDGLTWPDAFTRVQDGIDAAADEVAADPWLVECEVWVAGGSYYVYESDVTDTVLMRSAVSLYGGFDGTELFLDERDLEVNESVLDGHDVGGVEQVYHVVYGADDALLDGFTVTGGNAGGVSPDYNGGGMFNYGTSPTVQNCLFIDNTAAGHGGGMYNAMSDTVVRSCRFIGNTGANGGAVGNSEDAFPLFENCLFVGNNGTSQAGAMRNRENADPVITNCTFYGNTAPAGTGGALLNRTGSAPQLSNCILWNNQGGEIVNFAQGTAYAEYSLVEGGYSGTGNIDTDPLYEDAPGGDLRLQDASPCIDAGDGSTAPSTDLDGNPRVDDPLRPNTGNGPPWADMGAYEHQP